MQVLIQENSLKSSLILERFNPTLQRVYQNCHQKVIYSTKEHCIVNRPQCFVIVKSFNVLLTNLHLSTRFVIWVTKKIPQTLGCLKKRFSMLAIFHSLWSKSLYVWKCLKNKRPDFYHFAKIVRIEAKYESQGGFRFWKREGYTYP